MIADFYETFDESPGRGSDIPQEVLDVLSEKLPSNFIYYRDEDGNYIAGTKSVSNAMILKVDVEQSFIDENLKDIPKEKWAEYIYRMQLNVPVTNVRIGNEEEQIPIEETVGNPINNSVKMQESYLHPEPFPPAKDVTFETVEGDSVVLSIARKPYSSFDEVFLTNINFPALRIQFYISENKNSSRVNYTVNPTKASTVSEALVALHLFNGFYNGTLKVDGMQLSEPVMGEEMFDVERLKNTLDFWEVAGKMEKKLGVSFVPSAEFPMEDAEFFSHLECCILNDREIVWEHPFDHFHMGGISSEDKFNELLGKEGVEFVFTEGPIHATLLGAEFDIYSQTKLSNIVMTSIDWDDEKKCSGEIYVADPIGGKWKLCRKYMTEEWAFKN